jgi:hypothetical protein
MWRDVLYASTCFAVFMFVILVVVVSTGGA